MNAYRFLYDEKFIIETLSRHREQHKMRAWILGIKALCFLGLMGLLLLILLVAINPTRGASRGVIVLAVIPAFFMLLLLLGPRIDYFFLKRRFKRSPFYGCEARVTVTELGVMVETHKSQLSLSWSAFTKAKRLRDGFLLTSEPGMIFWWPDSSLEVGSNVEVGGLVLKHVG
jgi:hypothetical protein